MMNDLIRLEQLEVSCVIGIFDWERKIRQKVLIDLEIPADARKAARSDSIEDTVDYKGIAKHIIRYVEASSFQLIETLAEKLAAEILENFGVGQVRLKVSKPGAVRGSRNVCIEIERKRKPVTKSRPAAKSAS